MMNESELAAGDDAHLEQVTANLNSAQLAAVTADPGNLLVLAGAGSGKTRVLVHRLAYLVAHYGISPFAILAVTFTNKAAGEMRERAVNLLHIDSRALWIGTFHGIAHRLLRMHWREAKLPEGFEIIDAADQRRLVKRLLIENDLFDDDSSIREFSEFVNRAKDEGRRSVEMAPPESSRDEEFKEFYAVYESYCRERSLVDFGEMLLRCVELLNENPALLEHYQNRFEHILVDEFQDTNTVQYAWLKLMSGQNDPRGQSVAMTVVGDDDQSIYGWRGAKVGNIQSFERQFANSQVMRLEQNYRSTSTILNTANKLIAHNDERMGKSLWTEAEGGEKITVFNAYTERAEANFVIDTIQELLDTGAAESFDDFAVLYRTNAQSRVLEDKLVRERLPYLVYGGQRFYERMEIRNVLAYMRLVCDRHADVALERVINVPPRRLGAVTLDQLREIAQSQRLSLWDAIGAGLEQKRFSSVASSRLQGFKDLINRIADDCRGRVLDEVAFVCVYDSGLMDHHRSEKGEAGITRGENLEELINACSEFEPKQDPPRNAVEELYPGLTQFVDSTILDGGERQAKTGPSISLMTLHAAKGLEFPTVFLVGWELGLFPSRAASSRDGGKQEERRLAYVGITRAMQRLFLSYASSRMQWGRAESRSPSPFFKELPSEHLKILRPAQPDLSQHSGQLPRKFGKSKRSNPFGKAETIQHDDSTKGMPFNIGDRVSHRTFGAGTVAAARNPGPRALVQIAFDHGGTRWLMAAAQQLTKLD